MISPAQALFFDDHPGNVERAQAAGMKAILFTSLDAFSPELERHIGPLRPNP